MADTADTAVTSSRFLTISEVAARLNVSRPTIYRRITSGELPAVAVGQRRPLRVEESELEAWLYAESA